ncbi:hypothetical protein FGO68_gene9116 [Halteria grandinella]|uniref:malate synthase n=1 Tax=Halteria grandinella TaxID=5974 RepID=A0A8J8NTV2_HALGN|nr:hypothetical protein FGO68_gene9116 [Halteria grandinella]
MEESPTQVIKFLQGKHFLHKTVLPDRCLDLFLTLHNRFHTQLLTLIQEKEVMLRQFDQGLIPLKPPSPSDKDAHPWQCEPYPINLQRRQVEITAPPLRKQVVNALNAGADVFMADFDDALSPTWPNVLGGHYNLIKAIRRNLRFYDTDKRKEYAVMEINSQIFIQPRSLGREEGHMLVEGLPVSATLFDLAVYAFHNYVNLTEKLGQNCYFYIPKVDTLEEANFWNEMLSFLEQQLKAPANSFKITFVVESVLALSQLEEIVFALKERLVGLNTGRWNYIGSVVKRFRNFPSSQIEARHSLSNEASFLQAFQSQILNIAHKRGIHAIGGTSSFVPRENQPKLTEYAISQVISEKTKEAELGFDGAWVVHPLLVQPVAQCFAEIITHGQHQKDRLLDEFECDTVDQLFPFINFRAGELLTDDFIIDKEEVKNAARVCLIYYFHWLKGTGAFSFDNLMEVASTVEICRAQLWIWGNQRQRMKEGEQPPVNLEQEVMNEIIGKETGKISTHDKLTLLQAKNLLKNLTRMKELPESFLELAYPILDKHQAKL